MTIRSCEDLTIILIFVSIKACGSHKKGLTILKLTTVRTAR